MNHDAVVPFERLLRFGRMLGFAEPDAASLASFAPSLGSDEQGQAFAACMNAFAMDTPQLRIVMENLPDADRLRRKWALWFQGLFSHGLDQTLLTRLWRSGRAHVAHNLDHRLVSVAYGLARAFMRERVRAVLTASGLPQVMDTVDPLMDFCLLVETDAYVTYATRCELEVIEGIAHQVRNPIAVIGGQARKLLRLRGQDETVTTSAQVVLEEAGRLDHLARTVSHYMDVTDREPGDAASSLVETVNLVLSRLQASGERAPAAVDVDVSPAADRLAVDAADLEALLFAILDNALRFAAPAEPRVAVRCRQSDSRHGFATLTIDNNGPFQNASELAKLFSPFHSSLPTGTGMGLATAKAIIRKYSGSITMGLLEDGGTRCALTLPLPLPQKPEAGP